MRNGTPSSVNPTGRILGLLYKQHVRDPGRLGSAGLTVRSDGGICLGPRHSQLGEPLGPVPPPTGVGGYGTDVSESPKLSDSVGEMAC